MVGRASCPSKDVSYSGDGLEDRPTKMPVPVIRSSALGCVQADMVPPMIDLSTNLAGLELRNPVLLAAGTAGVLDESAEVMDLSAVGGLVTKSITPEPREGNQPWRVAPLPVGMLNAVGLANPGVEAFASEIAPRAGRVPTTVIGSVAGFSIDDYVSVCAAMEAAEHIPAVELNVSCPNVHGGVEFGADPNELSNLIRAVRPVLATTRLFVKLPPLIIGRPSIVDAARAVIEPGGEPAGPNARPGADAITIANTIPATAIDVTSDEPLLGAGAGGLSGPAVHPIAVKLVRDAYTGIARDTRTPIIGVGGVLMWADAAEFLLAGATAVQIGTGLLADPRIPIKVVLGLTKWADSRGFSAVSEAVGRAVR